MKRLPFAVATCLAWGGLGVAGVAGAGQTLPPDKQTIRAGLRSLPLQLRSVRFSERMASHLESPTGSRGPTSAVIQYDVAVEGDRVYHRQVRDPASREDQVTVFKDGVIRLWLRNPIGPGVGKIRRPEPGGRPLSWELWRAMPWLPLQERFRLNADSTPFQVKGLAGHRGIRAIEIAWAPERKGSPDRYRALLSLEDRFLPVFIEETENDEFRRSFDVVGVERLPGGVSLPAVVVERMLEPAGLIASHRKEQLPKQLADKLYYVRRSEIDQIEANIEIDDSLFEMRWAPHTEIIDEIAGISYYYTGYEAYEHKPARRAADTSPASPTASGPTTSRPAER